MEQFARTCEQCKYINRLDKCWANQELIFDYKSSLTGRGNRSFIDCSDIIDF